MSRPDSYVEDVKRKDICVTTIVITVDRSFHQNLKKKGNEEEK